MKILIDGFWWHEGPQSNRMVLLEIVKHWTLHFPDDRLVLAVPDAKHNNESHPIPGEIKVVRTRFKLHPVVNALELPYISRRESVDAILAFSFAAWASNGSVFLHDVLYQSNPEWFSVLERIYYTAIPLFARIAKSVITTSRTERDRISRYNSSLRQVTSCGLAVASTLRDSEPKPPTSV